MKIELAQIKALPTKGDLRANHEKLMGILGDLESHDVDVVVTPECFLDGYVCTEEYVSRGNLVDYGVDPYSSEYVSDISDWAARNSTWFVLGCTRVTSDGGYNTALILNREGKIVGMYDKVHCQAHDEKYVAGKSLPVFESDFGLFGVMICADRRWPETVRTLALKGARIIFNPTYGMHNELNLRMMRTRSYESEVLIAFTHPVQALITGPRGEILCNDESEGDTFTVTEVDLSVVDQARTSTYGHLKDRRPEVYEGLTRR